MQLFDGSDIAHRSEQIDACNTGVLRVPDDLAGFVNCKKAARVLLTIEPYYDLADCDFAAYGCHRSRGGKGDYEKATRDFLAVAALNVGSVEQVQPIVCTGMEIRGAEDLQRLCEDLVLGLFTKEAPAWPMQLDHCRRVSGASDVEPREQQQRQKKSVPFHATLQLKIALDSADANRSVAPDSTVTQFPAGHCLLSVMTGSPCQ
jgi:hypothetical protein